jgi:hypothetical protein
MTSLHILTDYATKESLEAAFIMWVHNIYIAYVADYNLTKTTISKRIL